MLSKCNTQSNGNSMSANSCRRIVQDLTPRGYTCSLIYVVYKGCQETESTHLVSSTWLLSSCVICICLRDGLCRSVCNASTTRTMVLQHTDHHHRSCCTSELKDSMCRACLQMVYVVGRTTATIADLCVRGHGSAFSLASHGRMTCATHQSDRTATDETCVR